MRRPDRFDFELLLSMLFCLSVGWILYGGDYSVAGVIKHYVVEAQARPPVERERPAFETRQWIIAMQNSYYGAAGIHVIETEGVCIYVRPEGGLAAVPKTQLLPGVGCQ